jgi:acetyl esterase/lipase
MERAALDAAYNNTRAVADFQETFKDFRSRSDRLYRSTESERDLRYGSQPDERFDLFRGREVSAPTVVYIHGGYWQTLSKEDFAFVAQGPLDLGLNVVLAEYTLAPLSSMTQIVQEIGRLLDHLAVNTDLIGRGTVSVVGHSAGGQLGLLHRSHRLLAHIMAISPLVDLEPISLSWLNEKLNLDAREVEMYSPLRHIGAGAPTTIAVGTAELPELVRHASEYSTAAARSGDVDYVALQGRNHFTVLEDLASATGVLTKKLGTILSP